ncbi:MAG: hypothetical protein WCJ30_05890 [Deltaproteobacteria bacterium]
MPSRLPFVAFARGTVTTRRATVAGATVLAAAFGLRCAIGVDPHADGSGTDATTTNDSVVTDMTVPPDAFPCTGTTCTVAHGMGACVNNRCQIGSCETGYGDLDRNAVNGCECATGMVSSNCGTPTDLGMMAAGGMRMAQGVLATTTAEHWIRVTFAPGGHPRIRLTTNPGMTYRFDVVRSCAPNMQLPCADRMPGGTGITDFEFFDNPGDSGMPNSDLPARMTPAPATTLIRMTTTAAPTECTQYTLAVSN